MPELFSHLVKLSPFPRFLEIDARVTEPEIFNYVSLKHLGTIQISYGESVDKFRLLARSKSAQWCVARLEKDRLSANFQGNPLWPEIVLRRYKNLSSYFCLSSSFSDEVCIIPQLITINKKLGMLFSCCGKKLPKKFGFKDIRDYEKVGKYHITDEQYVDTFIDEGKLPMAELLTRESVHDWSYHFVTFLFEEYLENLRLTLEFIRSNIFRFSGYTNYSWNYYGHSISDSGQLVGTLKTKSMAYDKALYRQMAVSLDVGTAKLVQLLFLRERGVIDKCKTELAWCEQFLLGVSINSLTCMLPMESRLKNIISLPEEPLGQFIGTSLMEYCDKKLFDLDTFASSLNDKSKTKYRQQVFSKTIKAIRKQF